MDLTGGLRRWSLSRPRVLVVDAPGADGLRWAVEAELDRRAWPTALSPADADVLLVLGGPGPELAAAIEVVRQQVPQPRLLLRVADGAHLVAELDAAVDALLHAADHPEPPVAQTLPETDHGGTDHSGDEAPGHGGMDHGDGHGGMDHGDGHGGTGHGGTDHVHHGGSVAGLPMADTGPDRDGLQLDVLSVALGPVLPGWPTGLVVRVSLQGDVVVAAEASWADDAAGGGPDGDPRRTALDRLARFLLVAGWPTAARDARRARDGLGSADPAEVAAAERAAVRLSRRVSRSRTLAWSVRGLGGFDGGGDVLDRVRRWCAVAGGEAGAPVAVPVGALGDLLVGAELAAARLTVASVGLERAPAVTSSWPHHG